MMDGARNPAGDPAESYRLEDQAGFKLRKAHQRASEVFAAVMTEFDVTPPQFAALSKLYDTGGATQAELGRMTAMDPATISGLVNRLKRRGLADQSVDPADARAVRVKLTAKGRALSLEMRGRGDAVSEAILAPLPAADRARFLAILDRLAG